MEIWKQIEVNDRLVLWIVILIFILSILIPIFRKIRDRKLLKTVTSLNRGTKSERQLVLQLLKKGVPAQTIFHDLSIEKGNGKSSQIDIVVTTSEGIIVFEVKDYSGWIFGNGNHSHWTKVLAYGKKKYKFYNPIKQNKSHIQALQKQLTQFTKVPFFSIIVFYGDCELKEINFVPERTFIVKHHRIFEVLKRIKNSNNPSPYSNKNEIIRILKQAVYNGGILNNNQKHIKSIKEMLGKDRIYD